MREFGPTNTSPGCMDRISESLALVALIVVIARCAPWYGPLHLLLALATYLLLGCVVVTHPRKLVIDCRVHVSLVVDRCKRCGSCLVNRSCLCRHLKIIVCVSSNSKARLSGMLCRLIGTCCELIRCTCAHVCTLDLLKFLLAFLYSVFSGVYSLFQTIQLVLITIHATRA